MVKNRGSIAKLLVILLLITQGSLLSALEFGLIINQNFIYADDYIEYTPMAIPWLAAPLGKHADLYISGGVGVEYENGDWNFLPEFYRTELMFSPSASLSFSIGRQTFSDSSGLILSGLFDGISMTWDIGGGRLNLGVFYTGLLNNKTALVVISPQNHDYFAPKHIAGGINWEKTSVFNSSVNMWLSGIFQVDLNDNEDTLHSQYLAAKIAVPLGSALHFDLSGTFASLLIPDFYAAFAMSANIHYLFYGAVPGMISLGGRYSSGATGETLDAFEPITGPAQSPVLRPILSGIALAQASYTARLHPTFFAELSAAYLFRTDSVSFYTDGLDETSNSPLLGGEFFLGLAWAPFSDLVFSLGGGVFLPQMGEAFLDTNIKYRIELTADISF